MHIFTSDYPTDFQFSLIDSAFFCHVVKQINLYVNDIIIVFVMCKKLAHVINYLIPIIIYFMIKTHGSESRGQGGSTLRRPLDERT